MSPARARARPWFPPDFELPRPQAGGAVHVDTVLARLGDLQHGVVLRAQLTTLGVSRRSIERRLASEHLHPWARGVYLVGVPTPTAAGARMAGVLAAGRDAALADLSGAVQHAVSTGDPPRVHVLVPPGRTVTLRAVTARQGLVLPHERCLVDGVPSLTLARLLLDLAAHRDAAEPEAVWHEAVYRRKVWLPAVTRVLRDHHRAPGTAALRRLHERRARAIGDVANRLEAVVRELVVEAGMPEPRANQRLTLEGRRLRPDLYVPERRLALETDGRAGHDDPERVRDDEARDALYRRAGITCYRCDWWTATYRAAQVLADLERYEHAWQRTGGVWTPEDPQPRFTAARRR